MKRFFVIALCCIDSYTIFAQKIIGKIVDADNNMPLLGASVLLENTTNGTLADLQGKFVLKNLKKGSYALKVSYVGYASDYENVIIATDDISLDIKLHRSTYLTDEVVVSATRATENSAMAFSNVSATELSKHNLAQDLPILLNFTPSMVTTSDAGAGVGYTGMRIRGSDASRINVTINGIPYNDAESHGTYFVDLPDFASSVGSIQVQRGVGNSTNGAGAFGASLTIQTNTFRKEAYAETNNSVGSFGTRKHTLLLGTGLLKEHFTVDARLSKIQSDGFIDRASSDMSSYYVSGAYFGKKSFVRLNTFSGNETTYQAWEGIPESRLRGGIAAMNAYIDRNGLNQRDAQNLLNSDSRTYNLYLYDNQIDNYHQNHYQLLTSHQINQRLNLTINAFYSKGKGYYEQFKDNQSLANYQLPNIVIGDATIEKTDLIRRKWLDNDFYGTVFSLDFNSFHKLKATIGGGWNAYEGKHFGEIIWAKYASESKIRYKYYDDYARKTDANLYGKFNLQISNKFNIQADIQARGIIYSFLGYDNQQNNRQQAVDFMFFNPKLGLNYKLTEQSRVYAFVGVGNKEPNRDDFTQSSPMSRPQAETLLDYEGGYQLKQGKLLLNVNAYFMNYQNQLVLTGKINDVGNYTRTNVAQSYRMGIEVEWVLALAKCWKWNANITLSQNKIPNFMEYLDDYDTGNQLENRYESTNIAFSPNIVAGSQWVFTPTENTSLTLLNKYVGKQFLDNTSHDSRSLSAYFTTDFRANYSLQPNWGKGITFTLLLNNILNATYESNGYTYGYKAGGNTITENFYYPQAGRNFLVGVGLKL